MFSLICLAAFVAFVAGIVCFVTADAENADRANSRAAAARVNEYHAAARAARNRDGYARLGASANR